MSKRRPATGGDFFDFLPSALTTIFDFD